MPLDRDREVQFMYRRSRRVTQPDPQTHETAPAMDSPEQESAGLSAEAVQALQTQAQQYRDGWQRERAEFDNYRRRAEREQKTSHATATGDAIQSILPVLDDFERAMQTVPADIQDNLWVNGVGMILRKFYKVLESNQVTILDPTGHVFDPSRHEAIATDDAPDVESGVITATMQKGYLIGDRVLRPALVRVAR